MFVSTEASGVGGAKIEHGIPPSCRWDPAFLSLATISVAATRCELLPQAAGCVVTSASHHVDLTFVSLSFSLPQADPPPPLHCRLVSLQTPPMGWRSWVCTSPIISNLEPLSLFPSPHLFGLVAVA